VRAKHTFINRSDTPARDYTVFLRPKARLVTEGAAVRQAHHLTGRARPRADEVAPPPNFSRSHLRPNHRPCARFPLRLGKPIAKTVRKPHRVIVAYGEDLAELGYGWPKSPPAHRDELSTRLDAPVLKRFCRGHGHHLSALPAPNWRTRHLPQTTTSRRRQAARRSYGAPTPPRSPVNWQLFWFSMRILSC